VEGAAWRHLTSDTAANGGGIRKLVKTPFENEMGKNLKK
jgi:hypothetical protein